MTSFTGAWPADDVQAFLDSVAVPMRVGCQRPDGSPWLVTLWYRYRAGRFECATAADADVVDFLAHDSAVSFEVSTNDPPYRGVRGNGEATVSADPEKRVLRALIERYLGDTDSELAERLLAPERAEVSITIDPHRIHSWDYSDRMEPTR